MGGINDQKGYVLRTVSILKIKLKQIKVVSVDQLRNDIPKTANNNRFETYNMDANYYSENKPSKIKRCPVTVQN